MRRPGELLLSERHGVNPSVGVCFSGETFLIGAMTFALGVLVAVPPRAEARRLTSQQEAFVAAQFTAQFGAFEAIQVRRAKSTARFPVVAVTTKPRLIEGERSVYALLDDEHDGEPCVLWAGIAVDHALVPVGEWPAGACAEKERDDGL